MRWVKAVRPALGTLLSALFIGATVSVGSLATAPTAGAWCYASEIRYGTCTDGRYYDRVQHDRDRHDRCDRDCYDRGPRPVIEARWNFDRQYCGDGAFWVPYGHSGLWVDPINEAGYRLEVVPNDGPFPWVNWVPV